MSLSVIVISYNAGRLRQCLEALTQQPEAREIIVADCSAEDPAAHLAPLFPDVRFLHFQEKRSVPELRWAAFRLTRGHLIASMEARSVPARDWCAVLVRAHEEHPHAPVIGGPIALSAPASRRDWGLYFCEYGQVAPPVRTGPVHDLSGANACYKREDLEQAGDLLDAGSWETLLHRRWRTEGRYPILSTATVFFQNALPLAMVLRQRLAYGRGYAAARFDDARWLQSAACAAFCPLLPLLLTIRRGWALREKGLLPAFWSAFPWIVLFNGVWSVGELIGYLFGESGKVEIY